MSYKNIVDQHVHTDNSFDGNHSAMFLCETACMKGLRAVAFTDHIEIDHYLSDNFDRTAIQSYFEAAKARSAFSGKLLVCCGIELGQPTYDILTAEKLLSSMQYDIVVGSIHNLRDRQDFSYLNYDEPECDCYTLLEEYFNEVLLLAEWGGFDTLAHLTYPLRYMIGNYGKMLDMTRFDDIIDKILKTLVQNGKALEINTSGLRQPYGVTLPEESIVQRFHDLGGEYITIGSDAHFAEHLGAGIPQGIEIAKNCGFNYITLFQTRYPTCIQVE